MDVEVLQVLRRYAAAKTLANRRAEEAFEDYQALPLIRYPHSFLLPRVWELRHELSAYDAVYVALAEALRAPLVTCDRALGAAARHCAVIQLF